MVMPKKHINLSESLIGIGGMILSSLGTKVKTLDNIIVEVNKMIDNNKNKKIYNNIDSIILSIDYLYLIGAIEITKEGGIFNVLNRT